MKKFSELMEKSGDTAVFTFGRMNPPTTGHGKLIDAMAREQKKNVGSKMHIFVSHSQDAKKNPLDYKRKVAYIRKMFPKYAKNVTTDKARTIFEVAVSLYNRGYKAIVMVVGSDRVDEFERLLNEYNGVDARHGFYGFDNIEVVSAGERDPDAEGVEGMSASKMRAAATDGDLESFKQGVPSSFKDVEKLYRDVRKSMGIREEKDMGEMDTYEEMRDAYLTGKIWNVGEIVEAKGMRGEIVRKGTNYISYMDDSGKVHKAWLQDIALNERNYRKEYDNYHSRPEQIEKRSSRNKARRAMGDDVVKGMDVGHKDNNPLNNNPKNLRNEDPSKNRREPRLREEDELDEGPLDYAKAVVRTGIDQTKAAVGSTDPRKRIKKAVSALRGVGAKSLAKKFKSGVEAGARTFNPRAAAAAAQKKAAKDAKKRAAASASGVKKPQTAFDKKVAAQQRKAAKQAAKREEFELDEMAWYKKLASKIDRMRHPKGYENLIQRYVNAVKEKGGSKVGDAGNIKINNPSRLAFEIAQSVDISPRDFVEYINTLVKKGVLPKELKAEYQIEDKQMPTDFKSFVLQMEKLRRVKQDPDVKDEPGTQPAKYYAGVKKSTKDDREDHFKRGAAMDDDNPAAYTPAPGDKGGKTKPSKHTKKFKQMFGEQPEHEIKVGNYTTKFFYMCGSAQKIMKKHADKEGAEELTRMQDVFYKMEKDAMDAGGASDEQKKKSQILYDKIIAKADDMGIKKDVDSYMKAHLTSMLNNKPKLGFGRTDLSEKLDKNSSMSDYIKDFKKSDAPQFKGKSDRKKHTMAVAAYLSRNEALLDRVDRLLTENGHTDVASMKVKVGIAYKALERMNAELSKLGDEDDLPTWWTNKVSTAVSRIDDMSDYLDYQVEGAYQLDEKIKGLVKKAEKSGMPYGVLKKVYDRGMAAWRTGHRPGTTPQQWAFARVNSFTTKSKGTWGGADKDLAKQVREVLDVEGEVAVNEKSKGLWYYINKKKKEGRPMRKKGEKGAPTEDQMKRAKGEEVEFKNFLEMFSPVHPTLKKELGTHGDHAIGMASTDKGVSVSFNKPKSVSDLKKQMSRHGYNSVTKVSDTTGKHKHVYHFQESKEEAELNEWGEIQEEAEYQGRKVTLNKPTKGDVKKSKVYVRNEKGNVVKVEFGDPNMEIKRDDPARRKSFRARHNCDNPGPKTKARYWSCKFWEKGKSVTDLMKG